MIKCQNIKHHKLISINPHIDHAFPFWVASHPTNWFNHSAYDDLKLTIIYSDDPDGLELHLDEAISQADQDSICIVMTVDVYWIDPIKLKSLPRNILIFADRMTKGKQFLSPILHWPRHWASYAKHYKHQDNQHNTEFFCPVYRGNSGKLLALESLFQKGLLNAKNYTLDHTERQSVVPIQKDKMVPNFRYMHRICTQRYHTDINVCTEDGYFNTLTEKAFQNLNHLSPVIWACQSVNDFLTPYGFDLDYEGIKIPDHPIEFKDNISIDIDEYTNNGILPKYFDDVADQLYDIVHNQASRDLYEKNYERSRHNQSIVNNKDSMHKIFAENILSQWQNL